MKRLIISAVDLPFVKLSTATYTTIKLSVRFDVSNNIPNLERTQKSINAELFGVR